MNLDGFVSVSLRPLQNILVRDVFQRALKVSHGSAALQFHLGHFRAGDMGRPVMLGKVLRQLPGQTSLATPRRAAQDDQTTLDDAVGNAVDAGQSEVESLV